MNRWTFEQLVSQWLDARDDPVLRGRVREALRGDPGLCRLVRHWLRLNKLVRRALEEGGSAVGRGSSSDG